MKLHQGLLALVGALAIAGPASAVELHIVFGNTGQDLTYLQKQFVAYEKMTGDKVTVVPMPSSTTDQFGQYRLWLAAGNADIDVYMTDVIWAPQLADHFVDLTDAAKKAGRSTRTSRRSSSRRPSTASSSRCRSSPTRRRSTTARICSTSTASRCPRPGRRWPTTAKIIMDKERAAGNKDMWGFVFQGNAYEGLTCDALEWVKSYGGGQIVEPDGSITINNPKAAAAIDEAKSWVGTISPPGVLGYQEEESRGVWQTGNSVFMRNWPYAYSLGNSADSPIKGKFDVATLPAGPAATRLGGHARRLEPGGVEVLARTRTRRSSWPLFMASPEIPEAAAPSSCQPPADDHRRVYDDPEVAKAQPIIPHWKDVCLNAVPRPSAPTKGKYNEVSSDFWTAVHNTLAGDGSAADNLALLEAQLTKLKGSAW